MFIELNKTRRVIGWSLSIFLLILFIYKAVNKFGHSDLMIELGLENIRLIVAIFEIIAVLLFFVPKTNIIGTILLSIFMGGAIVAHLMSGTNVLFPIVILCLVLTVGFVRNPHLYTPVEPMKCYKCSI